MTAKYPELSITSAIRTQLSAHRWRSIHVHCMSGSRQRHKRQTPAVSAKLMTSTKPYIQKMFRHPSKRGSSTVGALTAKGISSGVQSIIPRFDFAYTLISYTWNKYQSRLMSSSGRLLYSATRTHTQSEICFHTQSFTENDFNIFRNLPLAVSFLGMHVYSDSVLSENFTVIGSSISLAPVFLCQLQLKYWLYKEK